MQVANDRSAAEVTRFVNKIRVFDIAGQDNCGAFIAHEFPSIPYLRSLYQYQGLSYRGGDLSSFSKSWFDMHVSGHGALGNWYPSLETSHSVVEGDTPSMLHLLPNGLNDPDITGHHAWGSWGGRFTTGETSAPSRHVLLSSALVFPCV